MFYNYNNFWHYSIGFVILMIFIFIVMFLIAAGLYVLGAIGLYSLAKKDNIKNPWLVFIPVAQLYVIGLIIRNLKVLEYEIPKIELILPAAAVVTWIFSYIPVLGYLVKAAFIVLLILTLYKFFMLYKQKDTAVLFTVFSGITLGLSILGSSFLILLTYFGIAPIFFFILRNSNRIEAVETEPTAQL